jgi:hypothetical protein
MAALVVAAVLLAVPAASALSGDSASGFLVRVQGDVFLDERESADLVVVLSGDADVRGRAAVVVVMGGTARLSDARVGRLVVVRGTADLSGATVVLGDVWLVSARLQQAIGPRIGGAVRSGFGLPAWRWLVEEPVLAVGVLGLVLLVGCAAAAAGAETMRRAGQALTADLPGSVGLALLLFLVAPVVAILAFFTVVGLPMALVYLVVALPALGLLGFSVAALRLGQWLFRSGARRPYGAVVLGSVVLAAVGLIPFVGQVLVPLACILGGGALALVARRAYGGDRAEEPAIRQG